MCALVLVVEVCLTFLLRVGAGMGLAHVSVLCNLLIFRRYLDAFRLGAMLGLVLFLYRAL
jgi:hypothetical protein